MNEQNEFIKNYLHTEYVGCLKTDHEKCIDLQYEEIGNFVQNAGMFGDLEISIKHNGLVLFDTNGIYINKVFPNTEYSRDYLMELINSVAMQLQSDFDDGDIGHPTGKVNEFIKENFQVDLLNIEQENKINFSLKMNQDKIKEIRQKYPKGTRIMLNSMDDPHHPVPSGTLGTVETVDDIGTIHMKWDNGQSLGLIVGEDSFYVIESVQNQEKIREADEKIRVLVVEPMKEPKVEYIENTLDDMQRVVGGLIEEINLNDNTVLVCNEEGKLMNLQANRRVGRDVIAGTFFIAGDDGSEDLISLTDEQVNEYKERFHELEEIEQQEVFEKIEITIRGF